MMRWMIPWIGALAFALAWPGAARAADPNQAPGAPTAAQRQKMADIHQKMAECLRSDRPIEDCHKEMATACRETPGACPMMGRGHGGRGGGMMGPGHHGQGPPPGGPPPSESEPPQD